LFISLSDAKTATPVHPTVRYPGEAVRDLRQRTVTPLKRGVNERRPQRGRRRGLPQEKVMAAEEDVATELLAQFVHDVGEALLGVVLAGGNIEAKAAVETSFIHVGKFE